MLQLLASLQACDEVFSLCAMQLGLSTPKAGARPLTPLCRWLFPGYRRRSQLQCTQPEASFGLWSTVVKPKAAFISSDHSGSVAARSAGGRRQEREDGGRERESREEREERRRRDEIREERRRWAAGAFLGKAWPWAGGSGLPALAVGAGWKWVLTAAGQKCRGGAATVGCC